MTLDEAIAISEEIGKGDTTRAANNRWLAQKLRVLRWVEECHIIGEAQRARGEMHRWQLAYRRLKEDHDKLLESVRNLLTCIKHEECEESCPYYSPAYSSYGRERGGSTVVADKYLGCCTVGLENCTSMLFDTDEYLRELGIEVDV